MLSRAAGDLSCLTLEYKPICLQMLGGLILLEWLRGGRCCLSLCIFVDFFFLSLIGETNLPSDLERWHGRSFQG